MSHTKRWSPPRDALSPEFARVGMPESLGGFIRRVSSSNQLWISLIAVGVFVMNTAPLEFQRRILNAATIDRDVRLVVILGVIYAGIVAL